MANDTLSRLVEGTDGQHRPIGEQAGGPDNDKLDFWDSFAAAGDERMQSQDAARKKAAEPERKDFWDDFSAAGEARTAAKKSAEPERKDFWDDFAAIGETKTQQPGPKSKSAVGTAAMKKPGGGGSGTKDEWGEG